MRILPRSAKGTWLLAAAVWAAFGAVAFFAVPVAPRAVLRLPPDSALIGLGPDAQLALIRHQPVVEDVDGQQELELFDVSADQSVATVPAPSGNIMVFGQSRDGQIWLLRRYDPGARLLRFDLSTQSIHPLSVPVDDSKAKCETMSPDGQLCVLSDTATGSLILWDTIGDRRKAELPGLGSPAAISADGRSLVAVSGKKDERRISVIDLANRTTRFWGEWNPSVLAITLTAGVSSDGSYASVTENCFGLEFPTHCWNVGTKEKCFGIGTQSHGDAGSIVGRDTIVAETALSGSECELRWIDLSTSQTKRAVAIDHWAPWGVSPSGDTVELWVKAEPGGPLKQLADRIGLRWPFARPEQICPAFFDAKTGEHLGSIPALWDALYVPDHPKWWLPPTQWSPDGRVIAIGHDKEKMSWEHVTEWQLWDVPPRKSLTWFAVAVVILSLPIAWLARRRVRRLRREAA